MEKELFQLLFLVPNVSLLSHCSLHYTLYSLLHLFAFISSLPLLFIFSLRFFSSFSLSTLFFTSLLFPLYSLPFLLSVFFLFPSSLSLSVHFYSLPSWAKNSLPLFCTAFFSFCAESTSIFCLFRCCYLLRHRFRLGRRRSAANSATRRIPMCGDKNFSFFLPSLKDAIFARIFCGKFRINYYRNNF